MRLIILGAGGYGRVVFELAERCGRYEEIYFLDDNSTNEKVVGKCADYLKYITPDTEFYPAFGNNAARLSWLDKLESDGAAIMTLVDETAYISPSAKIESGTVVLPRGVVNTNTTVKRGCIINCGAIVDHDCVIGAGAHICLGAIVKAENSIPECMKIEAGEVVENRSYPINK